MGMREGLIGGLTCENEHEGPPGAVCPRLRWLFSQLSGYSGVWRPAVRPRPVKWWTLTHRHPRSHAIALPERSGSRTLRQPSSLSEEGATRGGLRGTDQAGERRDLEVLGGRDERRPQGGVRRDERAHGAM